MNNQVLTLTAAVFAFSFTSTSHAKKPSCDKEVSALKYTQSLMRAGQNDESTRNKERNQHKAYQECRQSKNRNSGNTVKGAKAKYSTNKQTKTRRYTKPVKRAFVGSLPVTIKGRFKGEKQQAWVKYYVPPKQCKKPQTTAQFSKCMTHRDESAQIFDIEW